MFKFDKNRFYFMNKLLFELRIFLKSIILSKILSLYHNEFRCLTK